MRALNRVRASGEQGSALAIALTFLMIFGVLIGVVLGFASTGQRTTLTVREEAANTYAGGGALEGAINRVRNTGDGTQAAGLTTCFSLPAAALGNTSPIDVTCRPRVGSGGASTAALASQPAQAVLARSTAATEGVSVSAGTTLVARGGVQVNRRLLVPATATLLSTGPNALVQAGDCTAATGSVTPPCATSAVPGDPGWAAPTAYPVERVVPACNAQTNVVTLQPGTYLSGSALQAALNCGSNRVIWFTPGTYYLNFRDASAANRELQVRSGAVVVGGAPLGWTPDVSKPNEVPVPTAAAPAQSACDVSQRGVQLVFAGDSRLFVQSGGSLQLCAEETGNTNQRVVLRGLSAPTAPLPVTAPAAGGAAGGSVNAAGGTGTAWLQQNEAATVNGNFAFVTAPRNTTSRALRVGPFGTGLVPADATNISVTVTLTGRMVGPGATNVRLTNGTTVLTPTPLRTCPAAGCNDPVTSYLPYTVTVPVEAGLTAAIANSLYVDVLVSSPDVAAPNGGATRGDVDGITISVAYSAPMNPTSGTGAAGPYVTAQASTTPIFRAAGTFPTTIAALHGTIDAQLAAVDLGVTAVPHIVVDRGLAVRHLQSSMTRATGYVGPLVSVPDLPQGPRRVLLEARDANSVVLARADVTFGNTAGPAATSNGTVPTINEWSIG